MKSTPVTEVLDSRTEIENQRKFSDGEREMPTPWKRMKISMKISKKDVSRAEEGIGGLL